MVQNHITMLIEGLPGKYFCHNTEDSASGPKECIYFIDLLRGSHPGEVTAHASQICTQEQKDPQLT